MIAFYLTTAVAVLAASPDSAPAEIHIPTVLIKLIDQADVPAREAGVLTEMRVREGDEVREGNVLARIDDSQPRFIKERAALELEIATTNAANDVDVRSAEKTLKVAEAELGRAREATDRFSKSISQTELERLRLTVEQATLAIEKAVHDQTVSSKTRELKEVELQFAEQSIRRRQITSPLNGVVVEIDLHRGEWVEPGLRVMRIVRLDRLLAEGFLELSQASPALKGRPVTVSVDSPGSGTSTFTGKIVFVSPESDPVDNRVRIHAEIDNANLRLRPGQRARMSIRRP